MDHRSLTCLVSVITVVGGVLSMAAVFAIMSLVPVPPDFEVTSFSQVPAPKDRDWIVAPLRVDGSKVGAAISRYPKRGRSRAIYTMFVFPILDPEEPDSKVVRAWLRLRINGIHDDKAAWMGRQVEGRYNGGVVRRRVMPPPGQISIVDRAVRDAEARYGLTTWEHAWVVAVEQEFAKELYLQVRDPPHWHGFLVWFGLE